MKEEGIVPEKESEEAFPEPETPVTAVRRPFGRVSLKGFTV